MFEDLHAATCGPDFDVRGHHQQTVGENDTEANVMREILDEIEQLQSGGELIALATVVKTSGSVPRPKGSAMAMTPSGKIAGSVSGGCLEGAVYEEGMAVLEAGEPKLIHYGITDEMAWNVGLSCGGEVDIFIEPLNW
jgi:xanthine/CO dehydrogenase XdhC/CoxF family maturation factor